MKQSPKLTSSEIGKAIGRSRQAVDSYIADLRAATQMDMNLKIFRMSRLGISQERIVKRLGIPPEQLYLIICRNCQDWQIRQIAICHETLPFPRLQKSRDERGDILY